MVPRGWSPDGAHILAKLELSAENVSRIAFVSVGRCELHIASRRLLRNGLEVRLTPKEFNLLALFVQHPGRALTRDEILRSVWGDDLLVITRSVDRFINTLRKKIEPDPEPATLIRTIRNIGYRFEGGPCLPQCEIRCY